MHTLPPWNFRVRTYNLEVVLARGFFLINYLSFYFPGGGSFLSLIGRFIVMQCVPHAEVAAYQYTQTSYRSATIWGASPSMVGAFNWHTTAVFFSRRVLVD
jgi:hypothetical protein